MDQISRDATVDRRQQASGLTTALVKMCRQGERARGGSTFAGSKPSSRIANYIWNERRSRIRKNSARMKERERERSWRERRDQEETEEELTCLIGQAD